MIELHSMVHNPLKLEGSCTWPTPTPHPPAAQGQREVLLNHYFRLPFHLTKMIRLVLFEL